MTAVDSTADILEFLRDNEVDGVEKGRNLPVHVPTQELGLGMEPCVFLAQADFADNGRLHRTICTGPINLVQSIGA